MQHSVTGHTEQSGNPGSSRLGTYASLACNFLPRRNLAINSPEIMDKRVVGVKKYYLSLQNASFSM